MQDAQKAFWSIPYVSLAFFPSSSKVSLRPDCIFEIHQLCQSDFSRVYSNCCCSSSFEPKIIQMGQSSQKMYSNKILNFQVSTTILNACTKVWKLIEVTTYESLNTRRDLILSFYSLNLNFSQNFLISTFHFCWLQIGSGQNDKRELGMTYTQIHQ